jgi:hypothetical protein
MATFAVEQPIQGETRELFSHVVGKCNEHCLATGAYQESCKTCSDERFKHPYGQVRALGGTESAIEKQTRLETTTLHRRQSDSELPQQFPEELQRRALEPDAPLQCRNHCSPRR